MTPIDLPTRAYVPGRTQRHPEGAFDHLRQTVVPGLSAAALAQTAAFRAGLLFLEQGYDWEAHEVLEPVWMACPDPSAERTLIQALIQLANASLKAKMERPKAKDRLLVISADLIGAAFAADRIVMGLTQEDVIAKLRNLQNNASG